MGIKCVIGDPATGRCKQIEIDSVEPLLNKSIGDTVTLDAPGLAGYSFMITGGSDSAGFPMRRDVDTPKKKILSVGGIGLRKQPNGRRVRKMVAGRMITERTAQINVKVVKSGKQPLFESPKDSEQSGDDAQNEKKEGA